MQRHLPSMLLASVLAGQTCAQTIYRADFDSLPEGGPTLVLMTGGLTFQDLDTRLPGPPLPITFSIENASAALSGSLGFTPSNALGFFSAYPGPQAYFSRFGSMRIIPRTPGAAANLNVFCGCAVGNSLTLAAYRGEEEVARQTIPITAVSTTRYRLSVAAPSPIGFDSLRLSSDGPIEQGTLVGLIDTVTVTAACYANCDRSTQPPVLNVADFLCFQQRFAAGNEYANCDGSTAAPVLTVADFVCFQSAFVAGCP